MGTCSELQAWRWSRFGVHCVSERGEGCAFTRCTWWWEVELHELMMLSLGEQTRRGQYEKRAGRGVQSERGSPYLVPCYLNNDGLSWLLAVKEPFHVKLWRHRVLLHWRANFLPFTLYDHVRVSSWGEKREFLLCYSSCNSSEPFSRVVTQHFSSITQQRRWVSAKELITPQMMSRKLSSWAQASVRQRWTISGDGLL